MPFAIPNDRFKKNGVENGVSKSDDYSGRKRSKTVKGREKKQGRQVGTSSTRYLQ